MRKTCYAAFYQTGSMYVQSHVQYIEIQTLRAEGFLNKMSRLEKLYHFILRGATKTKQPKPNQGAETKKSVHKALVDILFNN